MRVKRRRISRHKITAQSAGNHWFIVVLSTLLSPLALVLIWLLVFSTLFSIDAFTHLALLDKSEKLAEIGKQSESSVIIRVDNESKIRLGDEIDSRKGLFELVDKIFEVSDPKLIILDYYFGINQKSLVAYKKEYEEKVIWASRPSVVGDRYEERGFDFGLFSFDKGGNYREIKSSKGWGHDYLTISPMSKNMVTSVQLLNSYPDELEAPKVSPAISFLAFLKGEFGYSGNVIRFKAADIDLKQEQCSLLHINLPCMQLLKNNTVFSVPPLPSFYETYPAYFLYEKNTPDEISSDLDDKYVFISSVWDKTNDHYLSSATSGKTILANMFNLMDIVDVQDSSQQIGIPGVYFHATILDNILRKQLSFPTRAGVFENILNSVSIIVWFILITYCLGNIISFLLKKIDIAAPEKSAELYFIIFSCLFFPFFIITSTCVSVVFIDTNVLLNLTLVFSISLLLGSYYLMNLITKDSHNE